jgi:hypothetical protein
MIKIIRYSNDGFKPQYQKQHIEVFYSHLYFEIELSNLKYGIWCFIDGFEDKQSLNHIKGDLPDKYEAYVPDDLIVYDSSWFRRIKITDDLCKCFGIFIGYDECKLITNIRKL